MKIELATHFIRVSGYTDAERKVLHDFCRPLVQYGLTKTRNTFKKTPLRTYASSTNNRKEIRFHIGQKDELLSYLTQFGVKPTAIINLPVPAGANATFRKIPFNEATREGFPSLREEQPRICEYIVDNDRHSKLVTLRPGGGKTMCAMYSMAEIGKRTLITTKAGFIQRWIDDLQAKFDFEDEEFMVVEGTAGFIKLMKMAVEGTLNASVILVSSKVFYSYLKAYEHSNGTYKGTDKRGKPLAYPFGADVFYERMGIGFRVIDEVHQEFHHNYRMDLFTNCSKTLALSGTMVSSDRFMNRMYDIAFPTFTRCSGGKFVPFIDVRSFHYGFKEPDRIRWKGPMGGYSHNVFEQFIMSRKDTMRAYFLLIAHAIQLAYNKSREDGQKCLVFCASVDMCTALTEFLREKFPTLDVRRYTQEDDYDDLLEPDIAVSTVLSAGTAVDIPNLRTAIMTTAINSRQSNEQAVGRPRPLVDWPGVNPEFYYFVCEDVERHVAYHQEKREFFVGQVRSQSMVTAPFKI